MTWKMKKTMLTAAPLLLLLPLLSLAPIPAKAATATVSWQSWLAKNTAAVTDQDSIDNYSDLAAFGAAIKDARIVMLDEQTHGEENVFALKARLVRYLHEQHGYDVLMLESGMFDVDRIWRTASEANSIATQAPGNIFYLYANSLAFQTLLAYLQAQKNSARPLILAGMDSQHTGQYSRQFLADDLRKHLLSLKSARAQALAKSTFWLSFTDISQQLFAMNRKPPDTATRQRYLNYLQQLKLALPLATDYFWHRIIVSMEDQALRYWGERQEQRSAVMGGNLQTLLSLQFPAKKVIVWGHFVHLNRSGLPLSGNLGRMVARQYKDQAYVVHFTGNKGTYYDFFSDQNTPIIRFPGKTIENYLEQQAGPYNFTNWRKLPRALQQDLGMQAALHSYLPDGLYAVAEKNTVWHKRIDGTFYLPAITSSKP